MRIYVAARFAERERVRRAHELLFASGHSVTVDWTVHENVRPYAEHIDSASANAAADIDGIRDSDVFVLLTSPLIGGGSSAELGAALMSFLTRGRPRVYVVGPHVDTNVFYFHPAVRRREQLSTVLAEIARTSNRPTLM